MNISKDPKFHESWEELQKKMDVLNTVAHSDTNLEEIKQALDSCGAEMTKMYLMAFALQHPIRE